MRNSLSLRLLDNYQNDDSFRFAYQGFISEVFPGIDIEEWYQRGFWTEDYIPFSLVDSDKIISNVCAAKMNVLINGTRHKAIQISAVGTLPDYRHLGFARRLMNFVIDKYMYDVDLFFLFANDSVLDFYPKFGFESLRESTFIAQTRLVPNHRQVRKLDINKKDDYHLLLDLLTNRCVLTQRFGAEQYGFITMWHIFNFYRNNLFYLEAEDAVVIKEELDHTLHVYDVIFRQPFILQSILPKIVEADFITSIQYHFPPDQLDFDYDTVQEEHTGLFILGEIEVGNQLFRFPPTAIT